MPEYRIGMPTSALITGIDSISVKLEYEVYPNDSRMACVNIPTAPAMHAAPTIVCDSKYGLKALIHVVFSRPNKRMRFSDKALSIISHAAVTINVKTNRIFIFGTKKVEPYLTLS